MTDQQERIGLVPQSILALEPLSPEFSMREKQTFILFIALFEAFHNQI